MSRPVLAALLLLFAPTAFVAAQSGDAPAAAAQDPQTAYNDLVKAFNQAMEKWQQERIAAIKKAQESGTQPPQSVFMPPTKEWIARAQELAGEHAGKDDAVPFLGFVVKYASNERNAVKKAVETLANDHAKSKAIGPVIPHLANAMNFGAQKQVLALLDTVVGEHADAACKAQALVVRGTLRLQSARSEDDRAAAAQDLRDVAKVTQDADILTQAKDALFEIEHLQVGCTAPDIQGVDVEGVPFKLSDYRGKVVLLDFWGFW